MWMRAQTAVNDMFEIKINELECFCSQWEQSPNESDHRCQDQTLQTKGSLFFHTWTEKTSQDILFKEKQNKDSDRKRDSGIILSGEETLNWRITAYFLSFWEMVIITQFVSVKAEEFRKLRTIICCNYGSPLALLTLLHPHTAACNAHYILNALAVHI